MYKSFWIILDIVSFENFTNIEQNQECLDGAQQDMSHLS